jgi:GPI mannosyltransferase 1 subunit M
MGFFSQPSAVFSAAILLRAIMLVYGFFQDAYSPLKYTDIDYYVFTDAALFVSRGSSPYTRDTYRYTPLLAWLLYPTTWGPIWFSFGKVLFAMSDVLAGWLIWSVLRSARKMESERALKFASIWLLNPMVAQISTRGSSEGLLCVMVAALLWAVLARRIVIAGLLLGLAVHFKIYPFIYAASIVWWLEDPEPGNGSNKAQSSRRPTPNLLAFFTWSRFTLALSSFLAFMGLNALMYYM